MVENYEINQNTLAIVPVTLELSKVYEENSEFIVSKSTTEIIDNSCRFFGSSYLGRHEGTKSLIGVNYKSPIIIEEALGIIFFPTSSPRFEKCTWLALEHIEHYERKNDETMIRFKTGQELPISISVGSLENQIYRATRLESILRRRKLA